MSKSAGVVKKAGETNHKHKEHKKVGHSYEWEFAKPREHLTTTEKFKRYLYDPSEGTYCGRTPVMWLKLLIAYIILYICIAIFFMICMYGLMLTINKDHPRYVLEDSLIGANPGLGFRPFPEEFDMGNSLIYAVPSNKNDTRRWVNKIKEFLKEYQDPPKKKGARQMCDYDRPPLGGKVCDVPVDTPEWGNCTSANDFGFARSSPCVIIKLNRIFDWVPDYYNKSELPDNMPQDLKDYIRGIKDEKRLNTAWLTCHGEAPGDKENLGPVAMYPERGFPGYYYPFTNQEGYLSPLVAVHFERPVMNTLIAVECRIWAKNALYAKNPHRGGQGNVHFELLLD
ncbi:hypothetical protein GE061_010216 [Apolygus lucorum]|uniref:Uncharacterized protein n=1 Tax=Apolygus lucorum TaxID=248454 RepID=A0A6A4KA34_APOLU|nr:hypothetical protein GE061_010216 [Apolygus lucorum]